jgi:ATP-binding cassette subfamily B protein
MRSFIRISTGYASLIVTINTTALLLALWASNNNIITISIVYLSVTYTFTVVRHLWDINSIMRNYYRIMGDSHDMTEILLLPQEVQDTKAATKLKAVRGSIRFENVTFKHENKKTEKPLFNNLNITIKPGEKIGLVGHSGSGKTTLTKLILRFMDIQGGQITVDGQNIAEVTQQSLRKHIAYVSQEPLLFHRSLHENIAYGDLKSTEKEVKAVAKMANAHEFIDKLTDGYKTLVGERGIKLSGGQRQRVAIARAMLKNAPILILDEATSALDSESEALIQDALWKLMEGKTTIVIAHRLSTIQKMDRILVLDHGKVVEEGTHKELIRKNGIYSEFWDRQSGGFMNE